MDSYNIYVSDSIPACKTMKIYNEESIRKAIIVVKAEDK